MEISLDGRELALSPAMKGHGGREGGGEADCNASIKEPRVVLVPLALGEL